MSLGSLVSTAIIGLLAKWIGKKNCITLLTIPNFTFWIIIYNTNHLNTVIAARFIAGLTGGGIYRLIGLFIAEISESQLRGSLSALLPLAMYTGIFVLFILGDALDFFAVPLITMCVPILTFILTLFLPNTPSFFIRKKKYEQGLKSLMFYRTCTSKSSDEDRKMVSDEFEAMRNAIENSVSPKLSLKDFSKIF